MDDTQKMLQAIIHGQKALKQELVHQINNVRDGVKDLKVGLYSVEKNLTNRINKIGKSLAYLEDDTPSKEEFYALS